MVRAINDTGAPVSVPVGEKSLGRLFNVLGDTIDGKDAIATDVPRAPIHQDAPPFVEQKTKAEVFENWYQSDRPYCRSLREEKSDSSEVLV